MNHRVSKMPDTPWHMGYPKKQEEDPRRHKSRCVFYKKGTCSCVKSDCFAIKCFGSSHCTCYAETKYQADRTQEALTPSLDKVIVSGRNLSKSIDVKKELKAKEQKRKAYFQKISKTVFNKQLKEDRYIYKNIILLI